MKIKQTFVKGYETSQWEVCTGLLQGNWNNLNRIHQIKWPTIQNCTDVFLSISKQNVYFTHISDPYYRETMSILSFHLP